MAINPLQPPINYQTQMIDLAPAFEGFGQALAKRAERTKAEELKEAYKTDLQTVLNNPSMKAFNDFSLKYPQQREVIKDVASRFTTEQQDAEFNIGRDIAIALENNEPEVALNIVSKAVEARKGSNLSTAVYDQVESILLNTDDPDRIKKAKAQTNFTLTLLNPEKFGKVVDSLAKQKLDPEAFKEQQAKARKALQEATNAELTATDDVARAKASRKKEEADAKLKAIEAEFEEQKQQDEIKKRAAELGLTKAQTNEVRARTNKLGVETKKAVLELENFKKTGGADPAKIFEQEEKLRKEFQARTKIYSELGTTFSNIKASAGAKTGPGDIALITGFMKMLDPGSVVRETEFATARDTAGLFESLKNDAQKLESGQLFTLNSTQRQKYVDLAQQYLKAAQKKADQDKRALSAVVTNYKLNPDNVFGPEPVGGGRGPVNPPPANPPVAGQRNVTVDY